MKRLQSSPARWLLRGLLALGLTLGLAAFVSAQEVSADLEREEGVTGFLLQVLSNLFNSRGLMETLSQPRFAVTAFVVLNLIVFVETGLLVGFCLPGDSLLVTAGLICSSPQCDWSLPLLLVTLSISAIVGDSLGYAIGLKTGPRLFNRENSLFFHKEHLLKAQQFYEKRGGYTIILARFVPVLRTFAPVVAGIGRMDYRRFVLFNIVGGISWVGSMVLFGRFLPAILNPPLQGLLGPTFEVQDHIEKVAILVVLASVMPIVLGWLRGKLASRNSTPELVEAK